MQGFYSSPSCDGDQMAPRPDDQICVSILPRLATGISFFVLEDHTLTFLFFPVLRRGSKGLPDKKNEYSFYSSPSCDGDRSTALICSRTQGFLFFPVLRRGSITVTEGNEAVGFYSSPSCDGDRIAGSSGSTKDVSILPRLATGIGVERRETIVDQFLFFPVLRRGSKYQDKKKRTVGFYSSPSCDGDQC